MTHSKTARHWWRLLAAVVLTGVIGWLVVVLRPYVIAKYHYSWRLTVVRTRDRLGLALPEDASWDYTKLIGRTGVTTTRELSVDLRYYPVRLSRAKMPSAPLVGAKLSYADLSQASLKRADLRGACLIQANLSGADLREANLAGANAYFASLRHVDLRNADLRSAILSYSRLQDADLRGADLRQADLLYAYLKNTDLRGADLRGANLKCSLAQARIDETTRMDPEHRLAYQIVTEGMADRNLRGVDLSRTFLVGTDLRQADLTESNLHGAWVSDADLRGADLRGANLRDTDLSSANLAGADLRGAKYDASTTWPHPAFDPVQRGAVLVE